MANKLTTVEWLVEELQKNHNVSIDIKNTVIYQQAIEREKEQIVNAWDDGDYSYYYSKEMGNTFENGEEYYKANYGK